jgi:hypothetical protein
VGKFLERCSVTVRALDPDRKNGLGPVAATLDELRDAGQVVFRYVSATGGTPGYPENPNGSHQDPLSPTCNQPQIWMAAVSLSDIELASSDPSWPAFWLPFQDVTAHNHNAQWTEVVPPNPTGDGGTGSGNQSAIRGQRGRYLSNLLCYLLHHPRLHAERRAHRCVRDVLPYLGTGLWSYLWTTSLK